MVDTCDNVCAMPSESGLVCISYDFTFKATQEDGKPAYVLLHLRITRRNVQQYQFFVVGIDVTTNTPILSSCKT